MITDIADDYAQSAWAVQDRRYLDHVVGVATREYTPSMQWLAVQINAYVDKSDWWLSDRHETDKFKELVKDLWQLSTRGWNQSIKVLCSAKDCAKKADDFHEQVIFGEVPEGE